MTGKISQTHPDLSRELSRAATMQDEDRYNVLNIPRRPFSQGPAPTDKVFQAQSQENGEATSPNDKPGNPHADRSWSCSKQLEHLSSQNSNLSAALREMSTKLCQGITRNQPDVLDDFVEYNYEPYPERWICARDNCYYLSMVTKKWGESRKSCEALNSTLVKIDNKEELDFVSSNLQFCHWVGLLRKKDSNQWKWVDGSTLSPELKLFFSPDETEGRMCAYNLGNLICSTFCKNTYHFICEKAASLVRPELQI
uniref:C-type lectin domain-containing protein n=1 Tax=Ornithorhynchus anatinus TaxID=9258 RepID=A0A6I8NQX4_ORNAN